MTQETPPVAALAPVERFKYAATADVPAYDLEAVFKTADGPHWAKNPKVATQEIYARAQAVPEGEVVVLFCNVEFYKWFCLHVRRTIAPSTNNQMLASGIMGMFGPRCVIVCDAPVGLSLTANRAYYFCQEVFKPAEESVGKTPESDSSTL